MDMTLTWVLSLLVISKHSSCLSTSNQDEVLHDSPRLNEMCGEWHVNYMITVALLTLAKTSPKLSGRVTPRYVGAPSFAGYRLLQEEVSHSYKGLLLRAAVARLYAYPLLCCDPVALSK